MPVDFRVLFDALPGANLVLAPVAPYTILAVSDGYLQATMTTRDALVGRHLFDAFPDNPADPAAAGTRDLRASLEHVAREREPHRVPLLRYDIRRRDGTFEVRYWSPTNSPVIGDDGSILYLIHYGEDVTERVLAEEREEAQRRLGDELRAKSKRIEAENVERTDELQRATAQLVQSESDLSDAQRRLTHTLAATEVATWTWDVKNDRVFADPNLARLYSVSPEESRGGRIAAYARSIHPDDRARVEAAIAAALAGGDTYRTEYRLAAGGGQVRWVLARGRVERDDEGEAVNLPGVVLDITERKLAEEQLRSNHDTFFALIENAPFGVYVVDAAFRLRQVSAGSKAVFANVRPLIGRDFAEILRLIWPEQFAGEATARFRHTLATGEPYAAANTTERRRDVPGVESYDWKIERVMLPDGQFGVVCYFYDVTERRRAEELLRDARDAAETASRAKDKFLAVLSHELRTPLSPVVMTIPAIELDPDLPPKFRDDLAMVRRNIELEVKLIDDLLDLSRVTSGKLRLHMEPVRVNELLRHVVRSSASEVSGKRLRVVQELDARHDRIVADPARLQQVFWNLLRNAVKFTPEGGRIAVRTSDAEDGGHLLATVSDTGVGIPPEALPRIFDAFEQGDQAMTRQFGGLGLGLAVAKAVVGMHGGTISAASDGPGRGATFTVRLDAPRDADAPAPSEARTDPASRERPRDGAGLRLLLVEDHPDTARTLARLLRSSGYAVTTADSVASALRVAGAQVFDLVVSDIGLPDATGYELMSQIRERHGLRGIALSGYGTEDDVRRSRDAGFVDHVIKPVNLAQLESVIRRVTRGEP